MASGIKQQTVFLPRRCHLQLLRGWEGCDTLSARMLITDGASWLDMSGPDFVTGLPKSPSPANHCSRYLHSLRSRNAIERN